MNRSVLTTSTLLMWAALLLWVAAPADLLAQAVATYNANGTFNVPANVTHVTVECWGGGGKGGDRTSNGAAGGGGGGAYSRSTVAVTPGSSYTVTVGAGSTTTAAGGDSWFGSTGTVMAKGGGSVANNSNTGATGGAAASGVGQFKVNGGNGTGGSNATAFGVCILCNGGGGGSSAGYRAAGANGSGQNGGTAPAGGGNGGAGGGGNANGSVGTAPGGGGGGSHRNGTDRTGGNGANGRVVVTYYRNVTDGCMATESGFNVIPDNACGTNAAVVPVLVTGQPGTLGSGLSLGSVDLIASHTFNGDMRISLTSPGGQTRDLVLNRFGSGDNLGNPGACPGSIFKLEDGGTALHNTATTNVTGTWNPEQSLAGFTGGAANGVWRLTICDNANADVGRLNYVRLNFCTTPIVSITAPATHCMGSALNLTGNVTGAATQYQWTGPNGFTSTLQNPSIASPTTAHSGTFQFRARDGAGCWSGWASASVTVNPTPPAVSVPISTASICTGETPVGTPLLANACAVWNLPTAGTATTTWTGAPFNTNSTTATNYNLSVAALPAGSVVTSATLRLTGIQAFSPSWLSEIRVALSGMYTLAEAIPVPTNAAGGPHNVDINLPGFPITAGTLTMGVRENFDDTGVNPDGTIAGAQLIVNYTYPAPAPTNFRWYDAPTGGTVVSTSSGINPVSGLGANNINNMVPGTHTYYAVCESNLGCGARVPATFTVNARPEVVGATGGGTVCSDQPLPNVTFNFSGVQPFDFTISAPSGDIVVTNHNSTSYTVVNAPAGTYNMAALSDALCAGSELGGQVLVTVVQQPHAGTSTTLNTTSSSSNTNLFADVLAPLDGNAQAGGSWTGPNGAHSGLFNPTTDPEGLYTYTVNATSPCTGSHQATVDVTVVPMQAMVMEILMATDGETPLWQIRRTGTNEVVYEQAPEMAFEGSPVEFAAPYYTIEIEPGSYHLYFPNGLADVASYTLRTEATTNDLLYPQGRRFVDSNAPANTASPVQVTDHGTSNGTVQLPISDDRLLLQACDKYWWKAGDYVVANENPAVKAIWDNYAANSPERAATGYDFWFYDPNGGYSYIRERRHHQADGYGNVGSTRTCHMRVNSTLHGWNTPQHIPNGLAVNVRVRAVVNGVAGEWGPACRFTRDEDMANCPPTTLWRVPRNDPKYSCDDAQRNWHAATTHRIYAHPVSGATQYRFRFVNPNEGYDHTRTVSTYYLNMGWNANVGVPLTPLQTYTVTVQANKGGTLGPNNDGWCTVGDPCTILICTATGNCGGGMMDGGQNSSMDRDATQPALGLWPNPNRGDLLNVNITGLDLATNTIAMDILDLSGKRVGSHTIPVQDGTVTTVLTLNNDLAAGMYMVQVLAGDQVFTERLVIQP